LDYFFVDKLSVLEKDSYESSHPINFEVMNPSEIGGLFDDISYDKVELFFSGSNPIVDILIN